MLNYIDFQPNIDTFVSAFTKTNTAIGQTITGVNLNNNILTLNRFDGTNIVVTGFSSTNITSVTYSDIITVLGYTPYNSSNPNNYISSITFNNVVNALGYTPLSSSTGSSGNGYSGLTVTGDVTGNTLNNNLILTLPNTTIGNNYNNITYNSKGLVVSGSNVNYIQSSFTENIYYKLSNPNSFINFISGDTRYELITNKGIANGYVPLNSSIKIDNAYLPASVLGSVNYKGLWNASTNTPTLSSSTGTQGFYYIVSVSGNTNIDGITDWKVNDWIIFNGTTWDKLDNTENFISFNGRNGVITLLSSDVINALGYTPYNSTNPNQYIASSFTESTYYKLTNPNNYISSITSSNITTALGYTPYNSNNISGFTTSSFTENRYYKLTNPNNYISSITFNNVTTALGYIPLSSSTNNSVSYSGLTVSGDITGSTLTKNLILTLPNITIGNTNNNITYNSKGLVISGSNVNYITSSFTESTYYKITNLSGFTTTSFTESRYYLKTNPNNYISSITFNNVVNALGYTPLSSSTGGGTSSGITSINNQTNNIQTLVTGNTGNNFNIISSGGTHIFNIPTASSGITRGLLTSNDFNTFSNKANVSYVDQQIINLSSNTLTLLQNYNIKDLFYTDVKSFNSLPYYQSIDMVIINPIAVKQITPIIRVWSDIISSTYLRIVNQNGTTLSTSQLLVSSDTITTLTSFLLSGCTSLEYQILTDTNTYIKEITLI